MFQMLMKNKVYTVLIVLVILAALMYYYNIVTENFTKQVRDDINDEYIQWVFGKPAFVRPS